MDGSQYKSRAVRKSGKLQLADTSEHNMLVCMMSEARDEERIILRATHRMLLYLHNLFGFCKMPETWTVGKARLHDLPKMLAGLTCHGNEWESVFKRYKLEERCPSIYEIMQWAFDGNLTSDAMPSYIRTAMYEWRAR